MQHGWTQSAMAEHGSSRALSHVQHVNMSRIRHRDDRFDRHTTSSNVMTASVKMQQSHGSSLRLSTLPETDQRFLEPMGILRIFGSQRKVFTQ